MQGVGSESPWPLGRRLTGLSWVVGGRCALRVEGAGLDGGFLVGDFLFDGAVVAVGPG